MNEYAICCSYCGTALFYVVNDANEGSLVIEISCDGDGKHSLIAPTKRLRAVPIMKFLGELPKESK